MKGGRSEISASHLAGIPCNRIHGTGSIIASMMTSHGWLELLASAMPVCRTVELGGWKGQAVAAAGRMVMHAVVRISITTSTLMMLMEIIHRRRRMRCMEGWRAYGWMVSRRSSCAGGRIWKVGHERKTFAQFRLGMLLHRHVTALMLRTNDLQRTKKLHQLKSIPPLNSI